MRKHNKITSRKNHYSKQTIRNLISASNCLSGVHSVAWNGNVKAQKKSQHKAGTAD